MTVSGNVQSVSGGDYSSSLVLDDIVYSVDSLKQTIEEYAASSIYQYPSTSAVDVFSHVLKSNGKDIGYVIVSTDSSVNSYLYYSDSYTVNGNTVTLHSPVTRCYYNRYRPNNTSSYQYRYDVAIQGDETIYVGGGSLYYTNLVPGYPDVLLDHNSPVTYWFRLTVVVVLSFFAFSRFIRR